MSLVHETILGPGQNAPVPGPDRNRRVQPVYIVLIKTNYGYVAIS